MNTPQTETRTQAWSRRAAHTGEVDFTMMYVAHDAFNRDLARLLAAARAGQGFAPAALATWKLGAAGWRAFGDEIRDQNGGIKGGALYLPWVLDGATDDVKGRVLKVLPPPARLLYRGWERKYRNAGRLAG